MTLILELSPERENALKAKAQALGVSAEQYALQVLDRGLPPLPDDEKPGQPFETGYGMFAKYGPAPSAEEIDENRRDMFRNFAQEF